MMSEKTYQIPRHFSKKVFRAYDIRGRAYDELDESLAYALGLAFGTNAHGAGQPTVILGRDGRLSGQDLFDAVKAGLLASGTNVIDIGMVPSPLMYFATHCLPTQSGIVVTASHNPKEDNGLKMILNGKNLTSKAIKELIDQIQRKSFRYATSGQVSEVEVKESYIQRVVPDLQLSDSPKVLIDCGHGTAGLVARDLFTQMGAQVDILYEQVDGHFPAHHPDPTVPENMIDLQTAVLDQKADIGFAFDGDADRMVAVTHDGRLFSPQQQIMLFAQSILNEYPNTSIVYDVKCSKHVAQIITQAGGNPIMSPTGHSLIKAAMSRHGAKFSGEFSGHLFFADDWYGFDDGLYAACRLLHLLSTTRQTLASYLDALPYVVDTPEIHIPIDEDEKKPCIQAFRQAIDFEHCRVIDIDGVRIEWQHGWALIRASNTTAVLTLRFEADDEINLNQIKSQVMGLLKRVWPILPIE